MEYQGVSSFPLLLHCVPLYVCRLCINFQELCVRLLGMATLHIRFSPSFHALWLISCPLEKFYFLRDRYRWSLPMIVTPYGHVLYTKMLQIAWRCISAILRNRGGTENLLRTLTQRCSMPYQSVERHALPSKKIMESLSTLRTFVAVETVLRRGRMFQGSDKV